MSSSCPLQNPNPGKWRFTWETLAHIPTLRLFLFNSDLNPSTHCKNLRSSLNFEQSLLLVTWIQEVDENPDRDGSVDVVLLRIPFPRVLIDPGTSITSIAHEDHIEVKLALLLPVDHPLVAAGLKSVSDGGQEESSGTERGGPDRLLPLSMDSDLKNLSSEGARGGVHFYCRVCSTKLTKQPLRSVIEMPSLNWRDVADNWFGACCCSFGGISEKLVSEYVNRFTFAEGACLLDGTCVFICKDDLSEYVFPDFFDEKTRRDPETNLVSEDDLTDAVVDTGSHGRGVQRHANGNEGIADFCGKLSSSPLLEERPILQSPSCCASLSNPDCSQRVAQGTVQRFKETNDIVHLSLNKTSCVNDASFTDHDSGITGDGEKSFQGLSVKDHCSIAKTNSLSNLADEGSSHVFSVLSKRSATHQGNGKQLQFGAIGSGFMVRNANLSNYIKWAEFLCHQCSSLLGSYPFIKDGCSPVDGGIRLFKCCVSTSLPVGGSGDIFRNHTLQRVFVNQLLESATNELSFRTVVRDLRTKSPMLQIVILNSKAWCCTGCCLDTENRIRHISKIDLHPIVKVLYSDCTSSTEAELRKIEEWATKNHADEAYMMHCQIKELIESLKSAQEGFPGSCSFLQGFSLSVLEN